MARHSARGTRDLNLGRADLYALACAVLKRGAPFTFVASGVSMLPFVRGGDRLTIIPCKGEDLRRGDIAFYSPEGEHLLAHRVLGRSRDGITLLIRGDALWRVPERIHPSEVLGRVAYVERGQHGRKRVGAGSRLVAIIWHGLFPLPLRAYMRVTRWRYGEDGARALRTCRNHGQPLPGEVTPPSQENP